MQARIPLRPLPRPHGTSRPQMSRLPCPGVAQTCPLHLTERQPRPMSSVVSVSSNSLTAEDTDWKGPPRSHHPSLSLEPSTGAGPVQCVTVTAHEAITQRCDLGTACFLWPADTFQKQRSGLPGEVPFPVPALVLHPAMDRTTNTVAHRHDLKASASPSRPWRSQDSISETASRTQNSPHQKLLQTRHFQSDRNKSNPDKPECFLHALPKKQQFK